MDTLTAAIVIITLILLDQFLAKRYVRVGVVVTLVALVLISLDLGKMVRLVLDQTHDMGQLSADFGKGVLAMKEEVAVRRPRLLLSVVALAFLAVRRSRVA